jgi:hypothetical protein
LSNVCDLLESELLTVERDHCRLSIAKCQFVRSIMNLNNVAE